ncbi:hypothetical protein [Sorangium sp. So ce385]|uniref:hypothetical protein n=1 Tax=Sorangium sp. So ce385 TaxID=3133308 RepID=UPI003F5B5BE5
MRFADMDGDGASDWILTRLDKIIVQLRDRDGSLRATSTFPDGRRRAGEELCPRAPDGRAAAGRVALLAESGGERPGLPRRAA